MLRIGLDAELHPGAVTDFLYDPGMIANFRKEFLAAELHIDNPLLLFSDPEAAAQIGEPKRRTAGNVAFADLHHLSQYSGINFSGDARAQMAQEFQGKPGTPAK